MDKEALVVKRDILFKDGSFQGILPIEEKNLSGVILENHFYHERGEDLEFNQDLQQIIPYVWFVNPKTKQAFLYRRVENKNKADGEFREKRYLGNYSGGVGGHIDKDTEEGHDDPLIGAMMRELREEVEMENYPNPKVLGYVNDDEDSIGKVHFGVLAVAETLEDVKSKDEEGLADGKFYSIEEIDKIVSEENVEGWTRISWSVVKDYLQNL